MSISSNILQTHYDIISECISYGDIAALTKYINDFPLFLASHNLRTESAGVSTVGILSSGSLSTVSTVVPISSSSVHHPIRIYYPYLLHLSIHYDSIPIIQLLLNTGYLSSTKDTNGWTVYDLCIYYGKRYLLSVIFHSPLSTTSSTPKGTENNNNYPDDNGITESIYPSSYHNRVLGPNEYQLYLTLGSLGTVNGTQNTSPIYLNYTEEKNGMNNYRSYVTTDKMERSYVSATVTAEMDTEHDSSSRIERYCLNGYRLYPVHQALSIASEPLTASHSNWSTKPVPVLSCPIPQRYRYYNGKIDNGIDVLTVNEKKFTKDGYTVLNTDKGDSDTMIFTVQDIQNCSVRLQLFSNTESYESECRNSYCLGEGLISSHQFTQPTSTGTVTPWSNGLENLASLRNLSGSESSGLSPLPSTFRLSGQLVVPLMQSVTDSRTNNPRLRIVGEITLRYLFVRGGQSILNPLYSNFTRSNGSSCTKNQKEEGIVLSSIDQPIPSGGTPESLRVTNAILAANHPSSSTVSLSSTTNVQLPLLLKKDYWTTRTRIFGHRGSGADNAAIVQSSENKIVTSSATLAESTLSTNNSITRRTHILENTLLSFIEASKAGAEFCEFDVQLSRDGHPIIHHDWTLALPANTATNNICINGNDIVYDSSKGYHHYSSSYGFPSSTTVTSTAVHFPTSSSSVSSQSSSLFDNQAVSASIRVPITHLTLAQIRSLTPRAMTNGSVIDEFELAKAADESNSNYVPINSSSSSTSSALFIPNTNNGIVKSTSMKKNRLSGIKIGEEETAPCIGTVPNTISSNNEKGEVVVPATLSTSFSSSTSTLSVDNHKGNVNNASTSNRSVSRSRPPLPHPVLTGDVSTGINSSITFSPSSSGVSSSPLYNNPILFSPPRSPDSSASSLNNRTLAALGLDTGRADITRLSVSYHYGLRDAFTTLEETLNRVPRECGFNIEVKYATTMETALFGLRQLERNIFVDRILDVIAHVEGSYLLRTDGSTSSSRTEPSVKAILKPRSILFSSFDPDICLLLARKQAYYPVFLLTEAGTPSEPNPDPRMNSLYGAQRWAKFTGLLGIVSHTKPLGESFRTLQELQNIQKLIVGTYGAMNNNPEYVRHQIDRGVNIVIVDHVAHVRKHTTL